MSTFRAQLSQLNTALGYVSVVKPAMIEKLNLSGYLFMAKGNTCSIYSEANQQKARASFPIQGLDEGQTVSFVLPLKNAIPLSCLEGEITLKASDEGDHRLEYSTDGGAIQRFSTFDPRTLQCLDSDLESAKVVNTFNAAILREMLSLARSYAVEPSAVGVKENLKNIQIYDESRPEWVGGNKFMVASTGRQMIHLKCDEFDGKMLTIPGNRVPLILAFLSKSSGCVTLSASENSTYLTNSTGTVIGWSDSAATPSKFAYFGLEKDSHVLSASRSDLLKAFQYVRKSLDPKEDRASLKYSHETHILTVQALENGTETTSPPVQMTPLGADDGVEGGEKSSTEDFYATFSIDRLLDLVSQVKVDEVTVRVSQYMNQHLLRTIESFSLDSSGKLLYPGNTEEVPCECQVTRFIASKA